MVAQAWVSSQTQVTEFIDNNNNIGYNVHMKTYEIHYYDEHNHLKTAVIVASTMQSALNMFGQMYDFAYVGAEEKEPE